MNMPDLLNQAIEAARHGQAREAEAMLLEIVEADETNELAWLWLAEVVANPEERRTCLENVLALNPANAAARHDLQRLNATYPPDEALPASPIKPASKTLRPSQRPGLPEWLANVPLPTDPAIFREAHTPAGSERLARWLNTPLSTNKGLTPRSPDEEVMPVSSQDELALPDWLAIDTPLGLDEQSRVPVDVPVPDWLNLDPPATPAAPEPPRVPVDVPVPDWLNLDPPATPATPEPPRVPVDVPVPDSLNLDSPATPAAPEPPHERTDDSLPDWLNLDSPATPAAPEPPHERTDDSLPDWLSLDPPATPAAPEPPHERTDDSLPDWLNLDSPATPATPEPPHEHLEAQPIRDEPRASEIANRAEPIRDEAPSNSSEWLSLDAMTAQGAAASDWLSLAPSSLDQGADSEQDTPEDSAWPRIDERIARVQQLRDVAPTPETISDADAPVPEPTTPESVAKTPPKKRAFGLPLAPKIIDDPCPFCGTQTYVSDRTCRQCQKDLVLRKRPRTKRSLALNILLGLYGINGLFALGISLFGGLALLGIPGNGGEASGAMLSPASLLGLILVTGMSLVIMAGLWQRRPWAYIAHSIGLLLSIIAVMVAIFAPTLSGIAILVPLLGMMLTTLAGGIGALVLLVLSVILSVLSMDDFFTRMVRITSTGLTKPGGGYQRGLEYRKRGMWHLAAQTWEEAIAEEPRDVTMRRALGFVYAKMQRYDDARECLRVALAIEPDDVQLREDLAVIERLRVLEQQR
ncbi:tetratricopeptide repeat protein [Candidatus Chloroploca sp. Khr17]|uniref:tetratricopeptide repeat protein n=1 Tax=Candidatus Chloroploca sp. Khr17 TaxID=2496869 RepID=UPI00101CA69F|nr:tetratricopeptide repeat protein [Candidatus Chloroploca sp. Khr17]